MLRSTRIAAVSTILLALTTACSQSLPSQKASIPPTSGSVTASRPSPVPSKLSPPSPSPTLESNQFQDGLDAAMSAATIAQSAQSREDWNLVVSRWQSAIALFKTLPKSNPNYAVAQKKIAEYQRNLTYAQKQATNPSKPAAITNAIPPIASAPQPSTPAVPTTPKPNIPSTPTPRQTKANPSAVTPELALATHLQQLGAKLYGTYWCSYCTKQKQLFSQQALSKITYIECDPAGENAQPALCRQANITTVPMWEIQGRFYQGILSLQKLAEVSGYQGDRNFTS
ncbi:MAG TPA: hypothetical protein V6C91_19185 [Coleofasciculaceae cyanobacterium]